MDGLLWALQIVLALKFASVTYTHGIRPDQSKMQLGRQRLGAVAQPLLTLISLSTLLGGVGLILPSATGLMAWLTPWAAAMLFILMLSAICFHFACRERSNPVPGLILCALAAFVAYGRWVLVP